MDTLELIDILKKGEDSQHQFKQEVDGADQIASELVASARQHELQRSKLGDNVSKENGCLTDEFWVATTGGIYLYRF